MHPQRSFADVEYDGQPRQTRRERFLRRMEALMPWGAASKRASARSTPPASAGRPPYPLALRLRIHCVQLFYNLSDPAMEDALYDSVAVQRFVGLTARDPRPDETTILNFRHLLERHQLGEGLLAEITQHLAAQGLRLREGTIVDATIVDAPASTKNRAQARDPEMHQVKKGNQWYFGMKAHIGVDAATGAGAQRRDDGGQRGGYHASAAAPAWGRDAGVGRRRLCGRGPAPGAPGPEGRLAGGPATGAAAALGARQRRRPGGAAQGLDSSESRASISLCEAPLRATPRCGIAGWPRTGPGCVCCSGSPICCWRRAPRPPERALGAPRGGARGLPGGWGGGPSPKMPPPRHPQVPGSSPRALVPRLFRAFLACTAGRNQATALRREHRNSRASFGAREFRGRLVPTGPVTPRSPSPRCSPSTPDRPPRSAREPGWIARPRLPIASSTVCSPLRISDGANQASHHSNHAGWPSCWLRGLGSSST